MSSLVEQFDDYVRKCRMVQQADCTKEFLLFVRHQEQCRLQWKEAVDECQRLREKLDKLESQTSEYEKKLLKARKIVYDANRRTNRAEAEKEELQQQISQVQDILGTICRAGSELANETKEKLDRFLNTTHKVRTSEGVYPRLDTIDEINSTGSLLSDSDVSFSMSGDMLDVDLDSSTRRKKSRKSSEHVESSIPSKRRRSSRLSGNQIHKTSSDGIVATTTVSVPRNGPVTAISKIETHPNKGSTFDPVSFKEPQCPNPITIIPSAPPASVPSSSLSSLFEPVTTSESESADEKVFKKIRTPHAAFSRAHEFTSRTVLRPSEDCCVCLKAIPFATKVIRCGECKASAHGECREQVPLPCIPITASQTPVISSNGVASVRLVDHCRISNPPYVPPLLVRCVFEIERRGFNELGLYRVPGAEKDVRALKNRLLRGKGAYTSLVSYDVHVICGVLKDFLRSLSEPLITFTLWSGFIDASQEPSFERAVSLYQMVSELPNVNRDTLAFIMAHLQKVAASPACKMTKSNLAMVFGPTIVGYSNLAPTNEEMCQQTPLQAMVLEALLELSEDYWNSLLSTGTPHAATPATPSFSFRRKTPRQTTKLFNTPAAK